MSAFLKRLKNYDLPLHGVRLPEIPVQSKYKTAVGLAENATNEEFLAALVRNGIEKKVKEANRKRYEERAKMELDVFTELGFTDYVLLVWDIMRFCREDGIPTGAARGSGAGSLVLFLIDIIKVDALEHGLYFERFVNKTRARKIVVDGVTYFDGSLLMDVDLDICYYRRHEVMAYLEKVYPKKNSKILTLSTLSGKALIRDVGKIVGDKKEDEMKYVSGLVPKVFGKVGDVAEIYEKSPEFAQWCDENPLVFKIALKLRNLIKGVGSHASGFLISYYPLEEICPTELNKDGDPISAYDMDSALKLCVKLDLLGLKSVSVVDDICKSINLEEEKIDIHSPEIYQSLQELDYPYGCFQIEGDTNLKVTREIKPRNLSELAAVVALARPGALSFVDTYANFTNNGIAEADTGSKDLDKILLETGGCCIYQETLLRIAHEVFKLTLVEADGVRRGISKKKGKEVEKYEKLIAEKAKELGIPEAGEYFCKIIKDSASYSFNLSHAVSYAGLAAKTVYLKFKYPRQFFLSVLKMTKHEGKQLNEISLIHKEMNNFGIKLLPPNLLKSGPDFQFEGNDIRFGLTSIRHIDQKAIEKLNKFNHKHANKFQIFQAANEAGLSISVLSALIQSGALDDENKKLTRSQLVLEAQLWNLLTETEIPKCLEFGAKCGFNLRKTLKYLNATMNEKGKPLLKDSRLATIKRDYEPYLKIYQMNSLSVDFCEWFYERRLTGYTWGKTLRNIYRVARPNLMTIAEARTSGKKSALFIGWVVEAKQGKSAGKGTPYGRFLISDEFETRTVLIFDTQHAKGLENCVRNNGGKLPKEDDIVIIEGKWMGDAFFASVIAVQEMKIYTKWAETEAKKGEEEEKKKHAEKEETED